MEIRPDHVVSAVLRALQRAVVRSSYSAVSDGLRRLIYSPMQHSEDMRLDDYQARKCSTPTVSEAPCL